MLRRFIREALAVLLVPAIALLPVLGWSQVIRYDAPGVSVASFATNCIPYAGTSSALTCSPLYREDANTVAQRNSTTAQVFNWYYSYTDASNYQRGALKTSASGIEIAAETAGSGADDLDITLTPAGTGVVKTNAAILGGTFFAGAASSTSKALMNSAGSIQVSSGGFFGFTASATSADTTGDTGLKRVAAGVLGIQNDSAAGIAVEFTEQTAPAAGAANTARLYAKDNGAGKTQLCVIFATGAEQCFATEP